MNFLLFASFVAATLFELVRGDGEVAKLTHQHVNLTQLISRINVKLDEVVDADLDKIAKVYHQGNLCPFKRKVMTKIQNNEPISVMILGGSVTVGADLRNPGQQRWSTHFNDIMNAGWYTAHIDVNNQGKPACNVNIWVDMVSIFKNADVVIVDLSVNDQGFDLQELPAYYTSLVQLLDDLPNHPALLFHQAFRSGQKDRGEVEAHCPTDFTTCCDGVFFCRRWWDMHDYVTGVLKKYHVPYVSYRDLVWPEYQKPANNLNLFWNGRSHPDYKAHQLISKLISYGFMMQIKEAHRASCEDPAHQRYVSSALRDDSTRPICPTPLSQMLATDTDASKSSFLVNTVGDSWRFYNESKNKFGWLLETNQTTLQSLCSGSDGNSFCDAALPKHTLSLKVKLDVTNPVLQVKFLKSYVKEMGTAKLWLDDQINDAIVINSKWNAPYSVQNMVTVSKVKLEGVNGLMLGDQRILPSLTGGDHILNLAGVNMPSEKFKWKLLGVTTC